MVFIGAIFLGYSLKKENNIRGLSASWFSSIATSGIMTVVGDARILATSTRKYAIICNDDASDKLYLSLDADKPVTTTGENTSVVVAVNSCYEIDTDNLYTGSIRASSTVSSNVYILEATGY